MNMWDFWPVKIDSYDSPHRLNLQVASSISGESRESILIGSCAVNHAHCDFDHIESLLSHNS